VSKNRNRKAIWLLFRPYIYASLFILILCGLRLAYTFQFTHEYPRYIDIDPAESIKLLIASLTFRHPVDPGSLTPLGATHYGWSEYGSYFGLITLALLAYLLISQLEKVKNIVTNQWLLIIATCLALLISLGAFAAWSPFNILHSFPFYNQMRVPSRFICWGVLGMILLLAKLPKKPVFYVLLSISVLDVFAASYPILNYPQKRYEQPVNYSRSFQQYEFYHTDPALGVYKIMDIQDLRLLRATQQNYGELYGYEPVLDLAEYYFLPGTPRCGINKGCQFVMTNNAKVTYWSPLHITLRRTAPGVIKLNMNPGKVWQVNGKTPFADERILELNREFVINDASANIDIQFQPVIK
jgi:hypothetical protein